MHGHSLLPWIPACAGMTMEEGVYLANSIFLWFITPYQRNHGR